MDQDEMRDIKNVMLYWMEGEIANFIKVWLTVHISLLYCYLAAKIVPKGIPRLLIFLPVLCLFIALPLKLHSLHLGITSAFFVAWLANFKLIMFAFHLGPLSDPSISLPRFLAIASLPIRIQSNQTNPSEVSVKSDQKSVPNAKSSKKVGQKSILNYAVKGIILASMIRLYDYSEFIHPFIICIMYCFHIYIALEIILAIVATIARVTLGAELEPTFKEPLLSTSLQDFWGRRWNIMVTRVLRPTVYEPVHKLSAKVLGRELAPVPAVFSTFVVSALMHELIFYYMGRTWPTWRATWFFLLHGACLVVEIAVKRIVNDRWRLPRFVATGLVFLFVMVTGLWLFLPEMLRHNADVRAFEEYAALGAFVRDVSRALDMIQPSNSTTYTSRAS
ncbi:OLC1v1020815C1 [Oldenlandia corymbosa var. corymbosa]|uniref:OLC1v1020815C1 n=1 Tax=Oldenlandia corymbosa var. corymbosa TaxID=529605 RepID=A0AAV1BWE8_OLDCO|nr:OLC1v1020815C1 [Oldenlandia corymbosa var. corymbosa]